MEGKSLKIKHLLEITIKYSDLWTTCIFFEEIIQTFINMEPLRLIIC